MKDFNKLLYDILLKIDESNDDTFKINRKFIIRYFLELNDGKFEKLSNFETYFTKFYEFCFELSLDNVLREAINFKNKYGST